MVLLFRTVSIMFLSLVEGCSQGRGRNRAVSTVNSATESLKPFYLCIYVQTLRTRLTGVTQLLTGERAPESGGGVLGYRALLPTNLSTCVSIYHHGALPGACTLGPGWLLEPSASPIL